MAKSASGVAQAPNKRSGSKINSGKETAFKTSPSTRAKKGGKVAIFLRLSLKFIFLSFAKESIKAPNKEIAMVVAIAS